MLGSKRRQQRRNELESAETARRLALMVAHSTVMGRRAHSFRGSPWVSFLEILSLFREKVGWDGAGVWSHPALLPLRPWAFYKLFHLFVFNSCFISRSKWKILIGKVCDYVLGELPEVKRDVSCLFILLNQALLSDYNSFTRGKKKRDWRKAIKSLGHLALFYLIKYVAFNHIKRGECAKFMIRGFDK